jgi:CRP/FNR family transcriptional regulator
MGTNAYPANAVTVSPCDLLLLPAADFRRMMGEHEAIRYFVFTLLSQRLTEVMTLVEEVAFGRMDERLMEYLVERSSEGVLETTHQRIANDLGTAREVVSRILKDLERRGKISATRHQINLLSLDL